MKRVRSLLESMKSSARRALACSAALILPLWLIHAIDAALIPGTLARFGLRPRNLDAVWGLVAAPLLHINLAHLAANTVGLLLLGSLVAALGRREWLTVTTLGWLGGGLGVWILGRPAIHIGASGLVYAFLGFLLLRGWYERSLGSIALSLFVYWAFGAALQGMLPFATDSTISWEGHLFGFLAGVGAAALLQRQENPVKKPAPNHSHPTNVDRRPTAQHRPR